MSNAETWALIITINMATIALAIGSHMNTKNITPPRWIAAPWEHIVRFMEKPFRRKKAVYEPAGIIHYGEFHITIGDTLYQIYNQPNGKCEIWAWDEPLGEYEQDQAMTIIIDHAKGINHDR